MLTFFIIKNRINKKDVILFLMSTIYVNSTFAFPVILYFYNTITPIIPIMIFQNIIIIPIVIALMELQKHNSSEKILTKIITIIIKNPIVWFPKVLYN